MNSLWLGPPSTFPRSGSWSLPPLTTSFSFWINMLLEVSNRASTPVDVQKPKLSLTDGPLTNLTEYQSLVVALQCLTLTRPDLTYVFQQACLFMHAPIDPHLQLIKWNFCYVRGMVHYGLHISRTPARDMVTYSDADWVGCPHTHQSNSERILCFLYGANLISWSSKRRQPAMSRSKC